MKLDTAMILAAIVIWGCAILARLDAVIILLEASK